MIDNLYSGWFRTIPTMSPMIKGLCRHPYPGHPRGYPNWGMRSACPPQSKKIESVIDFNFPIYCVFNCYNIEAHAKRMWERHPHWSERQAYCLLYWQGRAQKQLRIKVEMLIDEYQEAIPIYCPEGMGVNVTKIMEDFGFHLEWPPRKIAFQVALVGRRKK